MKIDPTTFFTIFMGIRAATRFPAQVPIEFTMRNPMIDPTKTMIAKGV
jgi:hypothetical protein